MEKSFSFQRISILIGLDFSRNWKNYVWIVSVLTGCVLLMLLPPLFFETHNHVCQLAQYAAIPLVLLFGSSFYSSSALRDYAGGQKGIFALMIPASIAEKTVCALVVNFVFLIPFLIFFWQAHYKIIFIANERIPAGAAKYSAVTREVTIYISYCYFLFHSAVFVGSIYFSKSSYVKTLAFTIIGVISLSILNTSFAKYLAEYPLMIGAIPFAGWSVVLDSSLKVHHVSSADLIYPWQYLLPALMVSGFYAVAYLRLKEKQI